MLIIFGMICILVATLPLAAGYFQVNLPPVTIVCLLAGFIWLISLWQRVDWAASVGLLVVACAAMLGVWLGLSPLLLAISLLSGLLAWDLSDFSNRLRRAACADDLSLLVKRHLLRLGGLGGLSLILMIVALFVHVRISFGWLLLIAIVLIFGLLQLARHLRQSSQVSQG